MYSLTEIDGWNRVLVCVAALESTLLGGGGERERDRDRQTDRPDGQTERERESSNFAIQDVKCSCVRLNWSKCRAIIAKISVTGACSWW